MRQRWHLRELRELGDVRRASASVGGTPADSPERALRAKMIRRHGSQCHWIFWLQFSTRIVGSRKAVERSDLSL